MTSYLHDNAIFNLFPDEIRNKENYWRFFSHNEEEFWIFYHHITQRRIESDRHIERRITGVFYDNWGESLEFDPILGWVRKERVNVPCHETTNLRTRGIRDYSYNGKNIALLHN